MWYKQQHLNTQRMESAPNVTGSYYMLPDPTANIIYSIIVEVRQSSVQNKHQTCLQVVLKKKKLPIYLKCQQYLPNHKTHILIHCLQESQWFWSSLMWHKILAVIYLEHKLSAKTETLYIDIQHVWNPQQATDNLWDNMYILRAFV